jgi:hypothetical protein
MWREILVPQQLLSESVEKPDADSAVSRSKCGHMNTVIGAANPNQSGTKIAAA